MKISMGTAPISPRYRNQISMNTFFMLHATHLNIGVRKKNGRSVGTGRYSCWIFSSRFDTPWPEQESLDKTYLKKKIYDNDAWNSTKSKRSMRRKKPLVDDNDNEGDLDKDVTELLNEI